MMYQICLRSAQVGHLIGSSIGDVLEVDERYTKALRVRISLPVDQPLKRYKSSQITCTEVQKLRLKNERPSEFSHVCGRIGHFEHYCELAFQIKEAGGNVRQRFGPWLKVELENLWCPDNLEELEDFLAPTASLHVISKRKGQEAISKHALPIEEQGDQIEGLGVSDAEAYINNNLHVEKVTSESNSDANANTILTPATKLIEVPLRFDSKLIKSSGKKHGDGRTSQGTWKRTPKNSTVSQGVENAKRKRKLALDALEDGRAPKVRLDDSSAAMAM